MKSLVLSLAVFVGFSGSCFADSLPDDLTFVYECQSNCLRGLNTVDRGVSKTVATPVTSFEVTVRKSRSSFDLFASATKMNTKIGEVDVVLHYGAWISNDGQIRDAFNNPNGRLSANGELSILRFPADCRFTSRPDLGEKMLEIYCGTPDHLDFSGIARFRQL